MQRILHTPEGVRDIYSRECERKLALQERLHAVIRSYGYRDIETPTFEFFDVFSKEIGTIPSAELYKFFDREGNTLVLRPDFTPAVARAASKYFLGGSMPVRLTYLGQVFINNSSYQGRLKETTQIGGELMGEDSVDADAEIVALAVQMMLASGLEEFQITLGHAGFFHALAQEAREGVRGAHRTVRHGGDAHARGRPDRQSAGACGGRASARGLGDAEGLRR